MHTMNVMSSACSVNNLDLNVMSGGCHGLAVARLAVQWAGAGSASSTGGGGAIREQVGAGLARGLACLLSCYRGAHN